METNDDFSDRYIRPMTPKKAVKTAREIHMLLAGIPLVDERTFIEVLAPELYASARMENRAALQLLMEMGCTELFAATLLDRYEPLTNQNPSSDDGAHQEGQVVGAREDGN